MNPEFQWWFDKLNGKSPQVDETVQSGFYRGRMKKDGPLLPIATWIDSSSGQRVCLLGFSAESGRKPEAYSLSGDALARRWTFFCESPVAYNIYEHVVTTGASWPDEAAYEKPAAMIGDNKPPEGLELLKENLSALIEAVRSHLKTPEEKQDATWADKVGNYVGEIRAAKKGLEDAYKEEKAPHLKAGRAVDNAYKPVIKIADDWNGKVKAALTKWNAAEEARAQAEMVKQVEEVQAGKRDISEVSIPETPVNVGGKKRGGNRSAVSFQVVRRAKVTNYKKALDHWSKDDKIVAEVERLCNNAAKAGVEGPGWEVVETKEAK